jgi:hypothetical protein
VAAAPPLQDIRILCTNLSTRDRVLVAEVAARSGAVLLSAATAADPPHVVLTRRVGTPKYLAALRRAPGTPVVTPEWLADSVRRGRRAPYEEHAAGALGGLVVCFSGLAVAAKQELAALVARHGGAHSPALSVACTHLVTSSVDSDKFRFAARAPEIRCVAPAWLEESAAAGWCQDERAYPVPGATAAAPLQRAGSLLREASRPLADDGAEPARAEASTGRQPSASLAPDPSRSSAEQAADFRGAAPVAAVPSTAAPAWDDLAGDDAAPPFLENCWVWVLGCSAPEAFEALKLLRSGGAKRFVEPREGLTHVVVGSRLSALEADELARCLREARAADGDAPAPVSLEWLRRSAARGTELPADERFLLTPAALRGSAPPAPPPAAAAESLARGASGDQLARLASAGGATNHSGGFSSGAAGHFEGCYFSLAAVRGSPEEAAAERLIRAGGGRVFTASAPPAVAARRARAFAVCPPSLPAPRAAALRAAHPDFAAVDDVARRTLYWLECCAQGGALQPMQRGSPCYAPLPYPLPLPGMPAVSVAVSGYEPNVRAAIQRVVEIVGGRVSVEYMSARDTHLVVPAARGEKFRHAARLGVTPVTADWLVDSVTTGVLQPVERYAPRAPAGAPAAIPAAAEAPPRPLAARPPAGDGSGPSQVGATQAGAAAAGGPASFAGMFGKPGCAAPAAAFAPTAPGQPTSLREQAAQLAAMRAARGAAAATAPPPTTLEPTALGAAKPSVPPAEPALAADAKTPAAAPASDEPRPSTRGRRAGAARSGGSGGSRQRASGASPADSVDGADFAAALDNVSSILARVQTRGGGAALGSQLDMPPPPPRVPPGKRARKAEGATRRAGRMRAAGSALEAEPAPEMSQRVGYDDAAPAAYAAAGGAGEGAAAAAAAKQRLRASSRHNARNDAAAKADLLDGL